MDVWDDILKPAQSSGEAIRALFAWLKERNPKASLAYLSRKAKIPSRGYVSDIVQGRRIAHLKYQHTLPAALGLSGPAARYLKLLLQLDHEADPKRRARLETKRSELARVLEMKTEPLPRDAALHFLAFEVFCVLSLFDGKASRPRLHDYFARSEPATRVDQALDKLQAWGLVTLTGRELRLVKSFVLFQGSDDGLAHVAFLQECLRRAQERIAYWFDKPEQALIQSTMITVRRADYLKVLPKLRAHLTKVQANLDSESADMLVRFNVQVFPDRESSV